MPDKYTHKQLTEVEDSAPNFGFEGVQEARFASEALGAEDTGVSHMRVKPNKRQGFAHKHDDAEEVYIVVAGSGRVKLDDDILELTVMDAIRVSPGVTRQFEGGPEGLEYVVAGPHHPNDGEIVQDWWTD
jgi:mannose-6-phosphate isomerase-like protein (cupin superfamily)